MKTSEQWWEEVSADPEKLINWLKDQYHGERTAAVRISNLIDQYPDMKYQHLVTTIAGQEASHAEWVGILLTDRGVDPVLLEKESRYWDKVLPKEPVSFEEMCAIGHHAEKMRLDRIRVISKDTQHPDIADVFARILPEEEFHERAFAFMSNPVEIQKTYKNHESGLNALGLVH